jgi:imidazolonepropionase-like amidohydrolase
MIDSCVRAGRFHLHALTTAITLLAASSLCPAGPLRAQVTAIRAGQLLDPESGSVSANQVVLVENGRIKAVGAQVAVPSGATVIDLSRFTVMPGMFDAHTHLCMVVQKQRDGGDYYVTTLRDPTPFRAIQGAANARALLEAGFTTVRDVGNAGNYADTDLRRAIEAGIVPGPTIVNSGRIIAPYGGQFLLQPEKRGLGEPEYLYADTRDEMVKAIRENIHYGATVIKIVVDDQRYIYSIDDIRFMIAEARAAGLKVAAHTWTGPGAHNAAAAGVASIDHGRIFSDEDLEVAKRNSVVLVGTDYLAVGYDPVKPERAQWIDRLKRAYRIGVTMAYGTDVVEGVGEERAQRTLSGIDPWVEAGVPASVLLQALTANAARLLGVDGERGVLRTGLAADIIAVPGNPLQDVNVLKSVAFVMKNGKVIKAPVRPAS